MRITIALLLACVTALPAEADDREHDDKLCEVIGEAPNISVPPKDRLWFKENCTCAGVAGCGVIGSARFGSRLDAAKKMLDQQKAAAQAKTEAQKKAAAAKAAAARKAETKRQAEEAKAEAKRQKDNRDLDAFHDSILASFRTVPATQNQRRMRCSQGLEKLAFKPDNYCGAIETEFQTTPEYERLRERVVEVCKPLRECLADPADRDCSAERKNWEEACEATPDFFLCEEHDHSVCAM